MDYTDKTIWITGASSGIGRALAIEYSTLNGNLILSARNEKALEETKELCSNKKNIKILILDLADHESFSQKAEEAKAFFNDIDILINNGGISQRSLVNETILSVDKKLFDINYFGTIGLTKALLPYFINRKAGHIAVTSSLTGKFGTPLRSSYAASKHALHGFFDSLRAEHHDDGINVTIVCPGFINTNVSINALDENGNKREIMDNATKNGLSANVMAQKYIKAIHKNKQEVWIGKKERIGVYIKRFFPILFSNMIRKANVT